MNYDGRIFRSAGKTSGDVNAHTTFHYHQAGDVVGATYHGGGVAFGTLIASALPYGQLDMRYQQVSATGAIKTGRCHSTPELLADGRLRLHEIRQWTEGGEGTGESQIEEVRM